MAAEVASHGPCGLTLIFALLDLCLVLVLTWRIDPQRFRHLPRALAFASATFWGIFATALLWGFWEVYYRYSYPGWARWAAPVAALEYAISGLALWWLAARLPGHPTTNFCLLGGLESVPEHLWGIYGLKILEVPLLQGISPAALLTFAVFEYIFYWSIVLGMATILHYTWQRWISYERRSRSGYDNSPPMGPPRL